MRRKRGRKKVYLGHKKTLSCNFFFEEKLVCLFLSDISFNFVHSLYFYYFLVCNKKRRFDFADELKIGDVRYKHLTQITIKVQLF